MENERRVLLASTGRFVQHCCVSCWSKYDSVYPLKQTDVKRSSSYSPPAAGGMIQRGFTSCSQCPNSQRPHLMACTQNIASITLCQIQIFPKRKSFLWRTWWQFLWNSMFGVNGKVPSKEATPTWKLPLPRPSKILAQSNSNYNLW